MPKVEVRKGMPPRELDQTTFEERFLSRFKDPAVGGAHGIMIVTPVNWYQAPGHPGPSGLDGRRGRDALKGMVARWP
jgi:hypothetical protein